MSTHLLNLSLLSPQLPKFHLVFESDGQTPMAKQKVRNGSRKKSWSREQYKPPSIERERDFHQPHHCIVFPYAYHYSLDVHSNATTTTSCLPIHPTVYVLYMFVLYFCSPDGTSCTYLYRVVCKCPAVRSMSVVCSRYTSSSKKPAYHSVTYSCMYSSATQWRPAACLCIAASGN